jgi:hypothetical protein
MRIVCYRVSNQKRAQGVRERAVDKVVVDMNEKTFREKKKEERR